MKKILFLSCASAVVMLIPILTVVSLPAQTGIQMPVVPRVPAPPPARPPATPATNMPKGPDYRPTIQVTPPPETPHPTHDDPAEVHPIETPSVAPTESPRLSLPSRNPSPYETAEPRRTPAQGEGSLAGERFPETRTRLITEQEAAAMNYAQLRYAINEMYARHGADFPKDPAITRRFLKDLAGYRPRKGVSMDDIEKEFNKFEYTNEQVLAKYKAQRWASGER